jgi:hypothetical protein
MVAKGSEPSDDTGAGGQPVLAALARIGLVAEDEEVRITPLTGRVSSDVHLVETAGRRFKACSVNLHFNLPPQRPWCLL